ncbi:MAG: HEAT repeat domain-containing protein, partial [Planctomycetota bacterium]|nr:HEAT repeat domain-containing protein [Planctomycetota bacterium]
MPQRPVHRLRTAALLACLSVAQFATRDAFAQYGPVDPYESAVRVLREGVQSRNDGLQHSAMVALRELRDPTTRTLLEKLLRCDDWSLRVDSVLGLAEIDSARKVDPALIAALPREADRELAISAVLALELADQDRIKTMLGWDDVGAGQRVLLAGELRRLGGEPDRAELIKLLDSKTP